MSDATQRFTGRAADYERYRERYDPDVLLPRLRQWCGLTPDWLVADIGAGTGMLSDVFLANGNSVLAVEPNADMRSSCARTHALDVAVSKEATRLRVIDGTAEATTLASASIDLVAAGRALHWFDYDRALQELRRILKPEGWFFSVAFGRAEDGRDENLAFEQLIHQFSPNLAATRATFNQYKRLPETLTRDYHYEDIGGTLELTWPELLGLARSTSHLPLPSDPRFPALKDALRRYFERFAVQDRLTLATRCWISVGRFSTR